MQPTARASFAQPEEAAAAALASFCPPTQMQQQQQQQQCAAGGPDAAARAAQRQQWDARLASFQRGLDHVMHCVAGDACGSSLCHATRRLMRTYATHDCTNPAGSSTANPSAASECKVCKLWGYLLAKNKLTTGHRGRGGHGGPLGVSRRPAAGGLSTPPTPTLPPLSCGLASARGRIAMRGFGTRIPLTTSSIQRRVVITPEQIKAMSKRV